MEQLTLTYSVDVFDLENAIYKLLDSHKNLRLAEEMLKAQKEEIELRVRSRLILRSSGNPALTSSKGTGIIGKISRNITSGVLPNSVRKYITSWTGNISYMDENDPIFNLYPKRLLSHGKVRLWRILEAGTVKKFYPIKARSKSQLRFFWKKEGKAVRTKQVINPGVKGRNYFLKNNGLLLTKQVTYETDRAIVGRIKESFRRYIRRVNR